jgi:hypothetical protein
VDLSWGSPVGIAAFFAGSGIFFYGFFNGLAALNRSKADQQTPR